MIRPLLDIASIVLSAIVGRGRLGQVSFRQAGGNVDAHDGEGNG